MNRLIIKSTLSAAALAVSLGTIMTAKAEQVNETFVQAPAVEARSVYFSQAEMATEDGRSAVEQRIRKAAEAVCGPIDYEAGSLSRYADRKECYHQAVAQAMSQVSADQVATR